MSFLQTQNAIPFERRGATVRVSIQPIASAAYVCLCRSGLSTLLMDSSISNVPRLIKQQVLPYLMPSLILYEHLTVPVYICLDCKCIIIKMNIKTWSCVIGCVLLYSSSLVSLTCKDSCTAYTKVLLSMAKVTLCMMPFGASPMHHALGSNVVQCCLECQHECNVACKSRSAYHNQALPVHLHTHGH